MAIIFTDPDFFFFVFSFFLAVSSVFAYDPLLSMACSGHRVTNRDDFFSDLNATLSDLRAAVASRTRFAAAERTAGADPVYALFQCRGYLSADDCLSCFSAAASLIRNCSGADGAHVVYDGCFLGYENRPFLDQTAPLYRAVRRCGNEMASETGRFEATARGLVGDLAAATPVIMGHFAAARRNGVYAVAQCLEMVNRSGCRDCLKLAAGNIRECLPATEARTVDGGCFLRYSNKPFFGDNQTTDLGAFLPKRRSSPKNAIGIGVFAGVCGFVLLVFLLFLAVNDKVRNTARTSLFAGTSNNYSGFIELSGIATFRYKDLKTATNNFSENNKLQGGTADAYLGVLKNGLSVAVYKLATAKKLKGTEREKLESQVNRLSQVCHRNLVPLLGCCRKGSNLLLVYEFMANGSLDQFLYGGEFCGRLNWRRRFEIIVGMARGLSYLHDECPVPVIHQHIRSDNISLDYEFRPRIKETGLAKILEVAYQRGSFSTTPRIIGTKGYTAPEMAIGAPAPSKKIDTFSFGIVVLEVISGRKCIDFKIKPAAVFLVEWAWELHERDSLVELVDKKLEKSEYGEEEMKKVIQVALLCTQDEAALRPTMSDVVVMLLSKEGTSSFSSSSRALTRGPRPIVIKAPEQAEDDPMEAELVAPEPDEAPLPVPVKVAGSVFEHLGRLLLQQRRKG